VSRDRLAGLSPEERAERLRWLRLVLASESTTAAVQWRNPRVRPLQWQRDLGLVCDAIVDSALAGTGERHTIAAPPRHGKTEWTGRGMPLRAMLASGDDPMPVLYMTSTRERAEEVSHRMRSAVERYHAETRDQRYAPGRKWGTTEWETEAGHAWVGMGWSGSTGGIGCRLLVMDDVIGSSETYRSRTNRSRIRRVVQEDGLSRLMDGGAALQMETRRGMQDTTAWLTDEYPDTWTPHVWACHDPERGYLWPEMYGEAWRATMPHLTDSSPVWRSLYQQEPVPEGGTLIEPAWLTRTYPEDPEWVVRTAERVVMGVDLAFTGRERSDHCAFVVLAVRGPWRDVLHVTRRRMAWREQVDTLRDLMDRWSIQPGSVVVERAANGDAIIAELEASVGALRGERAAKDKATRLTPHLGTVAGALRLPARAPWRSAFIEELSAFTGTADAHDDQVDALVWAMVAAQAGGRTASDYLDVYGL